jgi:hypothetical protein
VLRCGYKSTVKLLFIPPNRGVGIEASAHTTVVDVVGDEVVEDVVEVVEDVVDVVDEVEDVGEVDVVDDEQVVDGVVESTADAGAIRYGPKNSNAITANIATKRIFFMNMTIAKFMKRAVCRNSSEI